MSNHPRNAARTIAPSIDPGSNLKNLRDVIPERAAGMTVSDAGRQSDFNSPHSENAPEPIV
jgi:hypothetical protein